MFLPTWAPAGQVTVAPAAAPWRTAARCKAFLGATLFAALLHAFIATGLDAAAPVFERPAGGRSAALSVRALPAPVADARPSPAAAPATPLPTERRPAPHRTATAAAVGAAAAKPARAAALPPRGDPDAATETPRVNPARGGLSITANASTAGVGPSPSGATPAQDVPLYATRIPPSATLNYRLRRGAVQGQAEFRWQHLGERYQVQLQASVAGATLFRQASEGGLGAAGLAPERFTDQRARRGTRAISFQRESGQVTFSSVAGTLDLAAGMQDRLSWIAQLAAVTSANPDRLAAGGEILLMLVGTRGEAMVWRFVSLGAAQGDDAGLLPAIHLQRMPASFYDTAIDVWLDAAPPHWPVRAQWRNGPADPALELWRAEPDAAR